MGWCSSILMDSEFRLTTSSPRDVKGWIVGEKDCDVSTGTGFEGSVLEAEEPRMLRILSFSFISMFSTNGALNYSFWSVGSSDPSIRLLPEFLSSEVSSICFCMDSRSTI